MNTYNKLIDHTLLKAAASESEIENLCQEAMEHGFVSVCVNPSYVAQCAAMLAESDVKVCTVVGFPLGATMTSVKVFEAKAAVEQGAEEIDMVIHVGKLKSGAWDYVAEDIAAVAAAVRGRALLKVIIETCLLTEEEKVRVLEICKQIGVDFVKTSTGFSVHGATTEDVALMRRVVGEEIGVKASGGMKDQAAAKRMVEAGANRLGTSSGCAIVAGKAGESAY